MSKPDLVKDLKNVSEKDRKQIEAAQEMFGAAIAKVVHNAGALHDWARRTAGV